MEQTETSSNNHPLPKVTDSTSVGRTFFSVNEEKRSKNVANPITDRFWSHVEKREPGQCWLWIGKRDKDGYGKFYVAGKWHRAPRVSLVLAKGPIPAGLLALHSCDNRACVNPAHLEAGTHQRNMAERCERGRSASGERNGRAKLDTGTVRAIRAAHVPYKVSAQRLALRFNVNIHIVRDILNRVTWRGIEPLGTEAA